MSNMIFETFPVGPLQCNCSIIGDSVSKQALVVDPGGDVEKILAFLAAKELTLVSIIHTHAHLDHILASGILKEKTGAVIHLHKGDKPLWEMVSEQCARFGLPVITLPDPDHWIEDDGVLDCCGGVALHTPGHTQGSVSFWFEEDALLVAGDTLFRQSIGRTDLPGGDYATIEKSIKQRIYTLNPEAVVITGHGPSTTIGDEMSNNQFVRA